MPDQVRVLRIVEYIGDRKWVEDTVTRAIHGTRIVGAGRRISAVTLHEYPEALNAGGLVDDRLRVEAREHVEEYNGNAGPNGVTR